MAYVRLDSTTAAMTFPFKPLNPLPVAAPITSIRRQKLIRSYLPDWLASLFVCMRLLIYSRVLTIALAYVLVPYFIHS